MELREAIYRRRATRGFTREPVSKELIEKLVDAAIHAPSAVNEQLWDFAIVQDTMLLDRISAAAKAHMAKAMASNEFPRRLHENLDDPDFHVFYHAPVLIVISAKSGDWATRECVSGCREPNAGSVCAGPWILLDRVRPTLAGNGRRQTRDRRSRRFLPRRTDYRRAPEHDHACSSA